MKLALEPDRRTMSASPRSVASSSAGRGRGARAMVRVAALAVVIALVAGAFVLGAVLHRDGTVSRNVMAFESRSFGSMVRGWKSPRVALPAVSIDMKFKNVQKIAAKREAALRARILSSSDDDFVKAEWTAEGRTFPVKMRLKGDWVDHLRGEKWSYRIEIGSGENFLGMRRFSIQHPETRNYLFEWVYHQHLLEEGVLAPRYEFAEVKFNGRDLGVFAVEEHFSKELIESHGRRAGVILKYDEKALWRQRMHNAQRQGPYTDAFLLDPDHAIFDPNELTSPVDTFGAKSVDQNPTLAAERDAAIGLLRGYGEGQLQASQVFDAELTGKFLAIVDLWSSEHQLYWHNLRFYYSPFTGRLEPIGFDGEPPLEPSYFLLAPSWSLDVVADPAIAAVYVRELRRMSTPSYLGGLEQRMSVRYGELESALYHEFGVLPAPWAVLAERARRIALELAPVKSVMAIVERGASAQEVRLAVRNVSTLPVEILGVRGSGSETTPAATLIAPGQRAAVLVDGKVYLRPTQSSRATAGDEYVTLSLPPTPTGGTAPQYEILYRLAGDEPWRVELAIPYPSAMTQSVLPEGPSVEQIVSERSYLRYDAAARELVVNRGRWEVAGNLVLPKGVSLRMEAGTTLRFAAGAYLLATAPLRFEGTKDERVVLEPQAESWGGIVVISAIAESTWHEVEVRDTEGVNIPGLGLLGGLNFFESPLAAAECRLHGSKAEDLLNVIHSRVRLSRVEIADAASDGIDGDFISGEIRDSSFHDIHGDAIDVSGSTLEVTRVAALRVGDKAVSAGEASTVVISELTAEDVGIGIAAKDRSRVDAVAVRVRDARVAALAAYTKKPEYGPGTLIVNDLDEAGSATRALVDNTSTIEVDGVRVIGTELQVKQLYAAGILGN